MEDPYPLLVKRIQRNPIPMATILPLDNTHFTTVGERSFYTFLRDALKPDSQCFAWYSPSVEGLEPDFILYTPEVGLVVFEVKDWLLEQIQTADQRAFALRLPNGREERRTHPLQQAREYMFALLNRIKASCPMLVSSDPRYKGKARIPVECAVVFSNITREAFCTANLDSVLPAEKVLFSDDMALALSSPRDSAPHRIRERLAEMLPPRFPFKLSNEELVGLREVLWPHVRIVLPERAGKKAASQSGAETILRLDAQQESLARRMDARDAVIRGPAGSGKTLVLVHKAIQELGRLRKNGSELPVLLVCFNLTLVHYLKRLLSAQRAPLGPKGIQVTHFYDFCRSLLAEPLTYENEDRSYYTIVTQMAMEAAPTATRYGAVLVDEGQDFSDAMMAVLKGIKAEDSLFWVACDTAQELYETGQLWPSEKSFHTFSLKTPYRATRSLTIFCEAIAGYSDSHKKNKPEEADIFSVQVEEGAPPRLTHVADIHQGAAYIAQRIHALHEEGIPYSEMMVLYTSSKHGGPDGGNTPEFLRDTLEENGILTSWASRNAQSKSTWDITTDSVGLSTIHSMKGLDAEAVFIWGLDALDTGRMSEDKLHTLAYVACTRARRHLEILYCEETPLVTRLRSLTVASKENCHVEKTH